MKVRFRRYRFLLAVMVAALLLVLLAPPRSIPPAHAQQSGSIDPNVVPPIPAGQAYRLATLVSDIPGFAPILDSLLVNPWGMTSRGTSPFWVVNNSTSTTQLIKGDVGGAPVDQWERAGHGG